MDYLLFAGGLIALVFGADRLVSHAVHLASQLGLQPTVVGIVIVGLGTSLPELVTSIDAALQGAPEAALGNVVGSNIANILLVLGVGALFVPIKADPGSTTRDVVWMLAASAVVILFALSGSLERWMGAVLVAALSVYLYLAVRQAPSGQAANDTDSTPDDAPAEGAVKSLGKDTAWIVVGMALLIGGAHVAVSGALGLAADWGLSESLAGIVLLALGTSLPELVVTIVSIAKRASDVAVGNVVGSTLFNLLGILGTTALVLPLPVAPSMTQIHLWVMLGAIVMAALFVRTGWRLSRLEGAVLLGAYPAYLFIVI